ncbi:histidinol-phosphatase [Aureimonas leprariae]|uniref:Histidinol-phosphatase n=1 Tax=Plantimonas leprariae TaxID=2615207 RepID=A0A7V7PMT1_9HYPH|nr:histidinol-phosphatase [Aureimonas leprariae]KAB0678782.1 histidinol-phosphatase [Aureimonas leprariae]
MSVDPGDLPTADFLFRLADAADGETLPRFRRAGAVDNKDASAFDPVTEADRAAERAIRALIEAEYPAHAVLGEEHGSTGEGPFRWVIDPIDGTRAFISGIPVWGTLIGLTVDDRARLGIMSQPFTGERFWADGNASWRSDRTGSAENRVRGTTAIAEAVVFTTTPRLFGGDMLRRFEALEAKARLTRFGTDCYAFAMLAAGQVDLVVEPGLKPYDIAALIPIVEQAGGIVTTFEGARAEDGGDVIAAATPELHAAALDILNG